MLERILRPSATTAAAVSSHDDSMPKINRSFSIGLLFSVAHGAKLPANYVSTRGISASHRLELASNAMRRTERERAEPPLFCASLTFLLRTRRPTPALSRPSNVVESALRGFPRLARQ